MKYINPILSVFTAIAAIILVFVVFNSKEQPLKGAPTGLYSTLAVATTTAVGPQEIKTIFSSNKQCTSRIIGTAAQPILITFGDPTNGDLSSTTLSGSKGHTQLASTTVAYDAEIYGCGRWSAYGYASSTITTTELR